MNVSPRVHLAAVKTNNLLHLELVPNRSCFTTVVQLEKQAAAETADQTV